MRAAPVNVPHVINPYGQQVVDIMSRYAAAGSHLAIAALAGAQQFREWQHYPDQDAVDVHHHTEFYYHAHAAAERAANEHGHFHVFARSRRGREFHHLIGISLTAVGMPNRLFLTNRWVTGEHWIGAKQIEPMVRRFTCTVSGRLAPVSRWITAMVRLYGHDILELHQQREHWFMRQRAKANSPDNPDRILESRRHGVVAQRSLHLVRRLAGTR